MRLSDGEDDMGFIANLNRCEELAARNDWISSGPDAGSRECVAAVKALAFGSRVVPTSLWRRGKKVMGNNVLPGTAIATFPVMLGEGEKFRFKGHSAIFVGYFAGGIEVYDQYPDPPKSFGKRPLYNRCGHYVGNDAGAFYVIELNEDASGEPALCGPSSRYE
ncbi:MAG: BPSL0067 family protein [Azoarcus sp.]|jgi:hypothetical protein|nr:BPSL0067 family protein [Azoarcus sp.]